MKTKDPNLRVAIINTVIAILQLATGIIVIPQVQEILDPGSSTISTIPIPPRPQTGLLNVFAEDALWVTFFSLGYAAAWVFIIGIILVGWTLIAPLPAGIDLGKLARIGIYILWVIGGVVAIFIRANGAPPLAFVIYAVEAQIVGILLGTGAGIALILLVLIGGFILPDLFGNLIIFAMLIAALGPMIGSIVGAWYGVYG